MDAVFPGTFDPFTIGHYDTLRKGALLFDNISVVIARNDTKKTLFTCGERVHMIESIGIARVQVVAPQVPTVKWAESIGASCILRGVRNGADYEYEANLARINSRINSHIQTVILPSSPLYSDISSSVVRTLLTLEDWDLHLIPMIPPSMWKTFCKIIDEKLGPDRMWF